LDVIKSLPFSVRIDSEPDGFFDETKVAINSLGHATHVYIMNEYSVPKSIFCLSHLESLIMDESGFKDGAETLPSEITRLGSKLTKLAFYEPTFRPILRLPPELFNLTKLETLILSYVDLNTLPEAIGQLTQLKTLDVRGNKLTSLPSSITRLNNLIELYVHNNYNLESLDSISGMTSLVTLWADECGIRKLPRRLPNIRTFWFRQNKITNLVHIEEIGSNNSDKKSFYFPNNRINMIPSEIKYMKNLEYLVLNSNQLTSLPKEIYNLTGLTQLVLEKNQFSSSERQNIIKRFNISNPNLQLII
jgi:Leucine-rich repeat (LRR) protein